MARVEIIGHSFDADQASIVCSHISDGAPVRFISHDPDGVVQVMCGEANHAVDDGLLVHLHHLIPLLEPLSLPNIGRGQTAELLEAGWVVSDMTQEELDSFAEDVG